MFIRKERTGIRKKRNVPTGLYKIRAMNQDLVKEKQGNSLIFFTLPNRVQNRHLGIVAHLPPCVKGYRKIANTIENTTIIAHRT